MPGLKALRQDIANGGDPDIYDGVRRQLPFPVPLDPAIDAMFMQIASTILRLFPDRIDPDIQNPWDARIAALEFCGNARTTREDVLRVLDEACRPIRQH